VNFVQSQPALPPAAGPRALLKARLAHLETPPASPNHSWMLAAAACLLILTTLLLSRSTLTHPSHRLAIISLPDSSLTPGAAVLAGRQAVCTETNTKNKAVPVALRRKVFAAYGLTDAEPRAYEVDYLITPALGGADDIHNLWPQSYSATVWNAEVKDALEDRLRDMVCDGSLDLAEAQREISINWIAAYKKYFHTDQPLEGHNQNR
jgi:hypothetical protein